MNSSTCRSRRHRSRPLALLAVMTSLFTTIAGAQSAPPSGWRWATEHPLQKSLVWNRSDTTWSFEQMAPGWHITTRSGALMYDPTASASGRYVLESVQILFPGTSQSGYGVFFGGNDLEGSAPRYLSFLARRDGHVSIEAHRNLTTTSLVPWTPAPAIRQVTGDSTARNVLRVSVERDSLRFDVNMVRVAAIARGDLPIDGHFGFRTGPDLNLHVTTLDYTRRLAPVPGR